MKKYLFLLLAMFAINANAQFKLTINGFVSEEDNSKDYLVYTFEGVSQEDLYVKVLSFVHKKFKNSALISYFPATLIFITRTSVDPNTVNPPGIPHLTSLDNESMLLRSSKKLPATVTDFTGPAILPSLMIKPSLSTEKSPVIEFAPA